MRLDRVRMKEHRGVHDLAVPKGRPCGVYQCGTIGYPSKLYDRHKQFTGCTGEARFVKRVFTAAGIYEVPPSERNLTGATSSEFSEINSEGLKQH
jgi:hypothetical protein